MSDPVSPPRERLLETAADLFYQRGTSLGVNELFESSGVSRATFYRHFPTKEHLIKASLELRAERWRDWFQKAVEAQTADAQERLLAIFDVLEGHYANPRFRGCSAINFATETADSGSETHQVALDHKKQVKQYLQTLAAAAGAKDAKELAEGLSLLMDGATVMAQLSGSSLPAQQAKRAAQSLVEKALS